MLDPKWYKIIISKNLSFIETCMRMKCRDLEVTESETMVKETRFEMVVPTNETKDNEVVEDKFVL